MPDMQSLWEKPEHITTQDEFIKWNFTTELACLMCESLTLGRMILLVGNDGSRRVLPRLAEVQEACKTPEKWYGYYPVPVCEECENQNMELVERECDQLSVGARL